MVGDIPAKLQIYKNKNYVLTSEDGKIKAVMVMLSNEERCRKSYDGFFYDKEENEEPLWIDILFSRGNGAGTFLIKEAVKKVLKKAKKGQVAVCAGELSKETGSSIPFYYNLGFRSSVKSREEGLEMTMENYNKTGVYKGYDHAYMYLDEEKAKKFLD